MVTWGRQNQGKPVGTDSADITVVAARIDNVESALIGNLSLDNIDINGGTIDGITLNATTPATGNFTALNASTLFVCGTVSGTVAFDAALKVSSSISITGSVLVGSQLKITGSNLICSGNANFGGTLTVTGAVSLTASMTCASTLTSTGQHKAHVTSSADQNSKGNGTPYAVLWDTETYDTGGLHSTSSNTSRFTVVADGVYLIIAQINFSGGNPSSTYTKIYVDGSEVASQREVDTSNQVGGPLQCAYIANLSATSYVECYIDSTNTTVNISASNSFFQIAKLF